MSNEDRDLDAAFTVSRREFIKIGCTAITGSMVAGVIPSLAAAADKPAPAGQYPVVDVAPLDSIKEGAAVAFTYPDAGSPAMLVRLPQSAAGGIGPDNGIVAYSSLCTHKGCPVSYRPERKLFICPCHWSSFDPAKAGQMVIGQGSEPLPQIALRVRGGMVQAVGIGGLIYGRHTNII